MRITSYNVTDVSYHYIGLRVIDGLPATARREEQVTTISQNILKFTNDRALRLMLPEPHGTFETVGEKVCYELVHFGFAQSIKGAYTLTDTGKHALTLLNQKQHRELRHLMIQVHLQTYDNLRAVFLKHMEVGNVYRPIVESAYRNDATYITRLLEPTFGSEAPTVHEELLAELQGKSPKKVEDIVQERVIAFILPEERCSVALFRALCDRLTSLRLVNMKRLDYQGGRFLKSYSPCVQGAPLYKWHEPFSVAVAADQTIHFYLSEPDFTDKETQDLFIQGINDAFTKLVPRAGYYDVPDIRDTVCEHLKMAEASFDEGMYELLQIQPAPFTTGLQYDGISAWRRPLVRPDKTAQIYNLIRRI